jgi:hypothetical protein
MEAIQAHCFASTLQYASAQYDISIHSNSCSACCKNQLYTYKVFVHPSLHHSRQSVHAFGGILIHSGSCMLYHSQRWGIYMVYQNYHLEKKRKMISFIDKNKFLFIIYLFINLPHV